MILRSIEDLLHSDNLIPNIVEKLGKVPIDFYERMASIRESRKSAEPLWPAGVLLILHLRDNKVSINEQTEEFTFLLIKRSSTVPQPGDLSCPGGMLNPFTDRMLRPLLTGAFSPILTGKAREYARNRDAETFKILTLFLSNAIRETWEEINICPFKIEFMGPLPTYSLHMFKRIIFPLVGFVKEASSFRPNSEVDRIIEIPLKIFFQEDNYGRYRIELSDVETNDRYHSEFPCLIYRDNQGHEEILWGATFFIIMNFLQIVFDFTIPALNSKRIIRKKLCPDYLNNC
jgi:8-oxo-dGTP pyrophosphatase MutT (NUDIX family)